MEESDPTQDYHWKFPDDVDRSELKYRAVVRFTPVVVNEPGKKNVASHVEFV